MHDIIVIGAGWSGVVAARDIAAAGHSVLVLEARDRIGGRAHTFTGHGLHVPIDLGCSWIHGELHPDINRTCTSTASLLSPSLINKVADATLKGYKEGNPARSIAEELGVVRTIDHRSHH
jgi:phytoene dehydrogenase-like protein